MNNEIADSRGRHSKRDAYTFLPLLILLPVSLLESVLLIFESGGIVGSPLFWLAFVIFIVSAVACAVSGLISVVQRCWRRLLSVLFAAFVSAAAMIACLRFEDEIHFQILRPFYLAEIARSGGVSKMEWPWRGGLGFDKRLVFDKSGASTLAIGEEVERRVDNCTYSTRRMNGAFYLQTMTCEGRG